MMVSIHYMEFVQALIMYPLRNTRYRWGWFEPWELEVVRRDQIPFPGQFATILCRTWRRPFETGRTANLVSIVVADTTREIDSKRRTGGQTTDSPTGRHIYMEGERNSVACSTDLQFRSVVVGRPASRRRDEDVGNVKRNANCQEAFGLAWAESESDTKRYVSGSGNNLPLLLSSKQKRTIQVDAEVLRPWKRKHHIYVDCRSRSKFFGSRKRVCEKHWGLLLTSSAQDPFSLCSMRS